MTRRFLVPCLSAALGAALLAAPVRAQEPRAHEPREHSPAPRVSAPSASVPTPMPTAAAPTSMASAGERTAMSTGDWSGGASNRAARVRSGSVAVSGNAARSSSDGPGPGVASGQAVRRTAPPSAGAASGQAVRRAPPSAGAAPPSRPRPPGDGRYSRPREGAYATGRAVARPPYARPPYWHSPSYPGYWYYPWGIGAWGFGWHYYDPYWWGGYYGGGGYTYVYTNIGSLRLKVKPREAQVFVDGYYVGVVDDFDGAFQRLQLEQGPHRVEIRLPGFETLSFDVRVLVDHTINLHGELRPLP